MATTFGAAATAPSLTGNAHKSSTYLPLASRHFFLRANSNKVSFRLTPRPKLRLFSKGLQSGWKCSAMVKAQLNDVATDGSSKAEASTPAKSEVSPAESKDAPIALASKESISEFITQVASSKFGVSLSVHQPMADQSGKIVEILLEDGKPVSVDTAQEKEKKSVQLAAGGLCNKRQIGSLAKNTGHQPIHKTAHNKHKQPRISPSRQLQRDARSPWGYYPLQQHRHHQQHIQDKSLQRVEPRVTAEARVSDDAQVEPEEGHEAGVGYGVVEREERRARRVARTGYLVKRNRPYWRQLNKGRKNSKLRTSRTGPRWRSSKETTSSSSASSPPSSPLIALQSLGVSKKDKENCLKTTPTKNQAGGNVDTNTLDGKPEKELLGGHPRQISDLGERDGAGDVALVSDMGLELGLAGGRIDQMEVEATSVGVDGEGGDALGEKANRESVGFEDVVEGGGGEVMVSGDRGMRR
ncbi:UNVERIFIED_CONTAM: hypothetical protein Scaly_2524600 [Sesamum calycinum]|uniref:Uncharacterized protein n=1 Tax=Sesamum calycinum TaxID=2727403 RepID=A0AAW2LTX7_9LAMI